MFNLISNHVVFSYQHAYLHAVTSTYQHAVNNACYIKNKTASPWNLMSQVVTGDILKDAFYYHKFVLSYLWLDHLRWMLMPGVNRAIWPRFPHTTGIGVHKQALHSQSVHSSALVYIMPCFLVCLQPQNNIKIQKGLSCASCSLKYPDSR